MTPAVLTLLLALGWAAATGSFTLPNLLFGALVGGGCLYLIRGQIGGRRFWRRVVRMAALALLFVRELILSALRVAAVVIRPRLDLRPALVAFPLTVTSDVEITLLANLITLTPGTLSVDVSPDRRHLLIHAIDVRDREGLIRSIREGLEAKVMEACR
jgi:multicomponent Na+:H+ antiporter subunit E